MSKRLKACDFASACGLNDNYPTVPPILLSDIAMAPSNKAKAAGVSASSFFDLQAEVSRRESELNKAKVSGTTIAAVTRPGKVSHSPDIVMGS
jgi:hypothetical protein